MPVPVCRTVQDAYDGGRADAIADMPAAVAELAARVAELITPMLEQAAARRRPGLLDVAAAAEQLGLGVRTVYELVSAGKLASVQLPAGERRSFIRIEQVEIDAFITRNRVTFITPPGGGWLRAPDNRQRDRAGAEKYPAPARAWLVDQAGPDAVQFRRDCQ